VNKNIKTSNKIFRLWPALPLLAGIGFSAALWSADNQEVIEEADAETLKNTGDQAPEEPPTPSDFKPSEEISEDFPVPLPSDI
jgi:hypothetical protein